MKELTNFRQFLSEDTIKEEKISESSFSSNSEVDEAFVEDAYKEAYEGETGKPFEIYDFDYSNVEMTKTIKIKNLVSNGEELGDVTLIATPEGWSLGF